MPLLRIRTKDGTERLQVEGGATLSDVKFKIQTDLAVPLAQQALFRAEQTGPVARKGAAFAPTDDGQTLSTLGIANGDMLFLDYQIERENQAQYIEKDPFSTMVKEGELRKQGCSQWTLTNFLDYRSSKEFVLGSPPEPHCKFVQVDGDAVQKFMNYMIQMGFQSKRVGYLYGRWTSDEEGAAGVQVHAIYEPPQDCTSTDIVVNEDAAADARLAKLCQMLNLVRVGVIIGHPAREYVFTVNEIILASKLHTQAVAEDPENGKRFVTMKARPVLETEDEIEGVATVEAYQMTDQCVELVEKEAFSQSQSDPRVAKTPKDCCFIVEKKEQRKATVEMFVARVFDTARPIVSPFLSSSFVIENRITETQDAAAMASHLRKTKGRQPFLRTVSDLHFLFFLANFLDMNTDLPVLCDKVVHGKAEDLDGFEMMINCYAGLDM